MEAAQGKPCPTCSVAVGDNAIAITDFTRWQSAAYPCPECSDRAIAAVDKLGRVAVEKRWKVIEAKIDAMIEGNNAE